MRAGVAVLGLLLLGAIASVWVLPRLQFDHDTRSLLREDPAADTVEDELVRDFGAEDILLLAWEIGELDAAEFRRVRAVAADLARLPGLEKTYSIGGRPVVVRVGKMLRPLTEKDFETPEGRAAAYAALRDAAPYVGTLYNPELDVVAVASSFRAAPRAERLETLAAVRAIARKHEGAGHIYVAGVTALTADAGEYAVSDLERIGLYALAAALLVLLLLCRSIKATLAAVLATGLPPLLALGCAAAFALPLTALGAALFPVLAVVGITSSVHLLHAFGEERTVGVPARAAAFTAARRLAAPIILSLATTAAAFASLETTGVPAFRAGGLVVALGMVLAIPVVLLGLPTLLALLDPPPRTSRRGAGVLGAKVARTLVHRPATVVAIGAAVAVLGGWGALRADLRVEVLQAFRPESEIARTYAFLDERLTPTVPIDLIVDAHEGVEAPAVAAELAAFGARAEADEHIERPLSLATLLDYGKKVSPMPLNDQLALGVLKSPLFEETTRRFWDWERNRYRLKLRVHEGAPPAVLDRLAADAAALQTGRGRLTGLYVRAVGTSRALVGDLVFGALAMTLLAAVTIAVALRSWRLGVAALLPNVVPVAAVFGAAALVGVPFDVSVVAVGSVAVGLAIDDTLHMLFRLTRERRLTGDLETAVVATHASVGRALVLSTVVLVAGLGCLAFSAFLPTARFGLFTALACAVALPADLLLLPALVRLLRA